MLKKIAIIGDSLIQCLWASYFAQSYSIKMFSKSNKIGGAWFSNNCNGKQATNNIICPGNHEESLLTSEIFSLLHPLSTKLLLVNNSLKVDTLYTPKQYIVGNFGSIMENLKDDRNISRIRHNVEKVELDADRALLDGEKFDYVLFNENFKIDKITIANKCLLLDYENFVSRHLTIQFSNPMDTLDYTSAFDNVFDRGGFLIEDRSIFVGRVRREFKALSDEELIDKSHYFSARSADVEQTISNYFNHERPKNLDLKLILRANPLIPAIQTVTSSFIPGYTFFKHNRGIIMNKIESRNSSTTDEPFAKRPSDLHTVTA